MEPPAVASGLVDTVDLGPPADAQALCGLQDPGSDGRRIAGGNRVPTHLESVVAEADLPVLVAEIKGYVQSASGGRILAP